MRRSHKAILLASGLLALTGCYSQQAEQAPPWELKELDGNVFLLNNQTGETFLGEQGYLIALKKVTQSDLQPKSLEATGMPDQSLNFDMKLNFRFDTTNIGIDVRQPYTGEPGAEPNNESVERLLGIITDRDETIDSLQFLFLDANGVELLNMDLDDFKASRIMDSVNTDQVAGVALRASKRIPPQIYAQIESLDISWFNK